MDRKVVLIFGHNNSVSVITDPTTSPAVTVALLALLFALALGLNAALALSLAGTPRRTPLPTLLLQMALANALDCLLNVPVAALLTARWTTLAAVQPATAAALCRANAATFHAAAILQSGLLASLAVERAVTLSVHHASVTARRRSDLLLSWLVPGVAYLLALALALPVVATDVAVRYFHERLSCAATLRAGANVGYPAVVAALGFAVPGLVTCACAAKVARRADAHDSCRQSALLSALAGGHSLLVALGLVVAFAHAPGGSELAAVVVGEWSAALAWVRLLGLVAMPMTALIVVKPARKRCEVALCCCRGNAVRDPAGAAGAVRTVARGLPRKVGKGKAVGGVVDPRTPVLFATAEGLHMRVLDALVGPGERRWVADADAGRAAAAKYRVEFCDVAVITSAPTVEMQASRASRASAGVATLSVGEHGDVVSARHVRFSHDPGKEVAEKTTTKH